MLHRVSTGQPGAGPESVAESGGLASRGWGSLDCEAAGALLHTAQVSFRTALPLLFFEPLAGGLRSGFPAGVASGPLGPFAVHGTAGCGEGLARSCPGAPWARGVGK